MQVSHILQEKGREVIAIGADATLSEAARLLARRRIGAVIIFGEDGSLAGILSERDVVRAVSDESVGALARPVSAFMSRPVRTCSEGDSVDDLMEVMTRNRFRHLPVVAQDRICGIVSIGDIVKTRIEETMREAETLRGYIVAG